MRNVLFAPIFAAGCVFVTSLSVSAQETASSQNPILATVNGDPIHQSEIIALADGLMEQNPEQDWIQRRPD